MKIDKQNGNVAFSEDSHTYWNVNDNEKYISVTTLIHKFTQPFDKDFWSAYKALEKLIPKDSWAVEKKSLLSSKKFDKSILDLYDIAEAEFNKTQQEILDEWDNENRKSCERGTKIHEEIEHSFYNNPHDISLQKFGIGGKFECKKDYSELDLEYGVYPEYLIYRESNDGILRIAGQVDLIIKSGNEITIVDHKTNKKIEQKSGFNTSTRSNVKMKYPLNNLMDCNFYHYTMQLSTYAWMLQKINPNFVIKDLILNHYDHNGNNTLYHCEYLKSEVEKMLYFYKKQVVLERQREKRKRIEY
ncbi:MAG: PD-(D/E)XK nuclease family protein [Turicibacter sp.]|nr:PD-(D/E)XK nuclease family protein [Turicibacter sp.]